MRRYYTSTQEIELIVRKLDDQDMLRIMARENMEDWRTSAAIEQETVRAVIEAYAEGQIELPPVSGKVRKDEPRYAPSSISGHVRGGRRAHPCNAATVAAFLGWGFGKVKDTLAALELIERKVMGDIDCDGLSAMNV